MFDMRCEENDTEHRLPKIKHPCSLAEQKTVRRTVFPNGGQVERVNRTIKDATVKTTTLTNFAVILPTSWTLIISAAASRHQSASRLTSSS